MIAVVATLYVAGGILPLTGLTWALWKARRQYLRLEMKTQHLEVIATRAGPKPNQEDIDYWLETYSVGIPEAPHQVQLMYASELAQKAIWSELRKPAYLAGVGVIAGSVGSLLSLTL
jgi:hypothetical protein